MKPVVYSQKNAEEHGVAWHRAGEDIAYFANGLRRSMRSPKSLYTLRFSYRFDHDYDTVFFAYSYPYTYSQLTCLLNRLESDSTISE